LDIDFDLMQGSIWAECRKVNAVFASNF
jgi:hypothetical protein